MQILCHSACLGPAGPPVEDDFVERSGSGVDLRTLDLENPGSNPVLRC